MLARVQKNNWDPILNDTSSTRNAQVRPFCKFSAPKCRHTFIAMHSINGEKEFQSVRTLVWRSSSVSFQNLLLEHEAPNSMEMLDMLQPEPKHTSQVRTTNDVVKLSPAT